MSEFYVGGLNLKNNTSETSFPVVQLKGSLHDPSNGKQIREGSKKLLKIKFGKRSNIALQLETPSWLLEFPIA